MPMGGKASKAQSGFAGVNSADYTTPFGYGVAQYMPDQGRYAMSAVLKPELYKAQGLAEIGLNNNLEYLNKNPNELFSYAKDSPFYASLQRENTAAYDRAMADAAINLNRGGIINSTSAGTLAAQIAAERGKSDVDNITRAFQLMQETATGNVNTSQGVLANLANLIYPVGAAASANLNNAVAQSDQVAMFNAQQEAQQRARNQASMGSLIGAGLTGLGTIATGGLGGIGLGALKGLGALGAAGKAAGGVGSLVGRNFAVGY